MNKIILHFLILFFISANSHSEDFFVKNILNIDSIVSRVKGGDVIILKNGIYNNIKINFKAQGSEEKPIILKAESAGKVVFKNKAQIIINGKYLVVSGFLFKDVLQKEESVLFDNASFSNLTDCAFLGCGNPESTFSKIVFFQNSSYNNTIDHCSFSESISMSVSVKAGGTEAGKGNTGNVISRNYFHDIKRISSNGQEPVQLGQDQANFGDMKLNAIVENNLFERTNGDSEIISNKSSDNIIRGNTFLDSNAELTLRGGNNVIVENNYVKNCNTGIIIYGFGHKITGNIFENCGNGIRVDAAQYNSGEFKSREESGTYNAANNCKIIGNIIIDSKNSAIYFGRHFGTVHEGHLRDKKPYKLLFENNLIFNSRNKIIDDNGSLEMIFIKNLIYPQDKSFLINDKIGFIYYDLEQFKDELNKRVNSLKIKVLSKKEVGPGWE